MGRKVGMADGGKWMLSLSLLPLASQDSLADYFITRDITQNEVLIIKVRTRECVRARVCPCDCVRER
jgi:hypothetical protein